MSPTEAIEHFKLTLKSEFVPFSQSRNRGEKHPTLNWRVTLMRDGRDVLTTDYSAGCAFAPSYKQIVEQTFMFSSALTAEMRKRENAVKAECETGFAHKQHSNAAWLKTSKPILPEIQDVVYSLVSDSDVLDAGGFEDWANNFGYDVDSRKAEAIYRACLTTALKIRNSLGDATLITLRETFQDY